MYLATPDASVVSVMVSHVRGMAANANVHLVFLPRVTTVVTTILEEEGLFDRVGLHSYCWELMPLDHDVLSMELPHLFGDVFIQEDTTQISVVARYTNCDLTYK